MTFLPIRDSYFIFLQCEQSQEEQTRVDVHTEHLMNDDHMSLEMILESEHDNVDDSNSYEIVRTVSNLKKQSANKRKIPFVNNRNSVVSFVKNIVYIKKKKQITVRADFVPT